MLFNERFKNSEKAGVVNIVSEKERMKERLKKQLVVSLGDNMDSEKTAD